MPRLSAHQTSHPQPNMSDLWSSEHPTKAWQFELSKKFAQRPVYGPWHIQAAECSHGEGSEKQRILHGRNLQPLCLIHDRSFSPPKHHNIEPSDHSSQSFPGRGSRAEQTVLGADAVEVHLQMQGEESDLGKVSRSGERAVVVS